MAAENRYFLAGKAHKATLRFMVNPDQNDHLKLLLAEQEILVTAATRQLQELDQLFAAQKDAIRKGKTQSSEQALAWAGLRKPNTVLPPDHCSASAIAKANAPMAPGALLLVLEDDENDFQLLKRACRLAAIPARIRWAQSAQDAWAILAEEGSKPTPICIVADIQLPGIDGFEFLKMIESRGLRARVQFAFVTGLTDALTEKQARNQGADAFFVKPTGTNEWVVIAHELGRLVPEVRNSEIRSPKSCGLEE